MDFMNRGFKTNPGNTSSSEPQMPHNTSSNSDRKPRKSKGLGLGKIGGLGFLIALAIIAAGAVFALIMFDSNRSRGEATQVKTSNYQAVFLNGGQVYFGNITDLNNKYIRLNNIFYLRVNQTVQPNQSNQTNNNDVSLVKLGCELHGPQDQMVVNRDQVIFWENIKDDGQVVKAINEYKKQFPNGEDCTQQNNNSSSSNNTNATTNNSTSDSSNRNN